MTGTARMLLAAALASGVGGTARAECSINQLLELPVTMEGHSPLVTASVDGQKAVFEADSGAFFSTISPGSAAQFGLRAAPAPAGLFLRGVGGAAAQTSVVTVKDFALGGAHLHDIQFLVAGNEFGHAGLLGQNFFGRFDMEYDFAHGAIRFFRTQGCEKTALAYWAKSVSFSVVPIKGLADAAFHTIGDLVLDGATVSATFDTGASTSVLSTRAAAKAGVKPGSPGVEDGGYIVGLGRKRVRTWIGHFASIKIGDNEQIRNIRIRFGDFDESGESTMLLGADFFLSHRVLVDNKNRRLFLTYNGGPVFNLSNEDAPDAKPVAPGAALAGDEPTDADGYSRRGAAYLARRDLARGMADLRQAVKLAPTEPAYHRQLALALLRDGKREDAMQELDAAIAAKHDDPGSLLLRARLRGEKDRQGALVDADAFDAVAPRQSNDRLELAAIYQRLHAPVQAIRAYSQWLDAHPRDIAATQALNGRCWVRALGNIELDAALDDCNRAVKMSSRAAEVVDSRALVWFRRGDFMRARADYDAALAANPREASSLFMRGVTETRLGDKAAADRDIGAAQKLDEDRAGYFASWGIRP